MCLAIYAPEGNDIPEKWLTNGFENHSDGAGMAWAINGTLHVRKGMFKVEEVLEQYRAIKGKPCLIHFRKATSGKIDAANCHPFLFNDGKYALIHNGVLSIKCNIDGLSDTAHFVKLVLEPLVKNFNIPIDNGSLHYLITTSISGDKMCIMDGTGKTWIINEDKGTWDEGVWYSNTSFRYAYTKTDYSSWGRGTGTGGGTQTYFPGNQTGQSGATSFGRNKNWRKHWEDDEAGDQDYIDFWKRTGSAIAGSQGVGSLGSQTQRLQTPLLLTDGKGQEAGSDRVDDAGNVVTVEEVSADEVAASAFSEGQMCEYGWFDPEIEADIALYQRNIGLTREEAMIRVFNEK